MIRRHIATVRVASFLLVVAAPAAAVVVASTGVSVVSTAAVVASVQSVSDPGAPSASDPGAQSVSDPGAQSAGDRYVNNPTDDAGIAAYCADQAVLANNLDRQGDRDRAEEVVGAANMRGCRIYTFPVA